MASHLFLYSLFFIFFKPHIIIFSFGSKIVDNSSNYNNCKIERGAYPPRRMSKNKSYHKNSSCKEQP